MSQSNPPRAHTTVTFLPPFMSHPKHNKTQIGKWNRIAYMKHYDDETNKNQNQDEDR